MRCYRKFLLFFFNVCFSLCFGQKNLAFKKIKDIPPSAYINTIFPVSNDLYIGTNSGAYLVKEEVIIKIIKDKNIIDFASKGDSVLFMTDGIRVFDIRSGLPLQIEKDLGLINGIEIYESSLYIATNIGVYIMGIGATRGELKNASNSELKSNIINFIYADTKGRCWLGTESGEVRIDKKKWQLYNKDQNITHYYENKEGIWFSSLDKEKKRQLFLIDHFNRSYDAGFGEDLSKGKFNDFCIDNNGVLYFASDEFRSYEPYENKVYNFSKNSGYVASKATSTAVDKNNTIWLGTEENGLYKTIKSDASQLMVNCIAEKQPNCAESKDGSIRVIAEGGQSPYTYSWSHTLENKDRMDKLKSGSYIITVTDKLGTQEVCITELVNPEMFFVDLVSMSAINSKVGENGRIEVQPIGGVAPYQYRWSNGAKTAIISNLKSGTYTVSITDKKGCLAKGEYNLTDQKVVNNLTIDNISVGEILNIKDLSFKADSSVILPSSYKVLNDIVDFLTKNPNIKIEVGGHTNTIPPHEYCDRLSQARADSVAKYFEQKGIDKNRIISKGYGKRKPLDTSNSLEARQKNQRVEIKFLSL